MSSARPCEWMGVNQGLARYSVNVKIGSIAPGGNAEGLQIDLR